MSEIKPGKFLVFHDLEQLPNGLYTESPRHITLLPPVKLNAYPAEFVSEIDKIAAETVPFYVSPGEIDMFGPNKDIPVARINDPEHEMRKIHMKLLRALGAHGLAANAPLEYAGDKYTPHSTSTESLPELPDVIYVANLSYYYAAEGVKQIVNIPFGG